MDPNKNKNTNVVVANVSLRTSQKVQLSKRPKRQSRPPTDPKQVPPVKIENTTTQPSTAVPPIPLTKEAPDESGQSELKGALTETCPADISPRPLSIIREVQNMGFSSAEILNALAEFELRGVEDFSTMTVERLLQLIHDLQYCSERDPFRFIREQELITSADASQQTNGSVGGEAVGANGTRDCIICMEQESVMTFIPCGHIKTCESCADLVFLCPVCRKRIRNRMRIWF
ncbi:hypothetical protein BV898_09337 [Hypsibius exemplaris]|uniref:RING-type domain-containing protein n=1 Tax=Hypsibius exemplaris TaxID=2072580 RepID=A0A1W0WMS6_HYPEX|nr:hypothetical protein BV898_09337 [Hypsibius exemplaris]